MRLLTAAEMRAIDTHAIQEVGIPSLVLMENAGLKTLFTLEKYLGGLRGKRFTIVCGKGNNGGDGLVVARHLLNNGVSVNVFLMAEKESLSPETATNERILRASGFETLPLRDREDLDRLRVSQEFSDCVVDALFGTGFQGEISGFPREVIAILNEGRGKRVAIDIPSGVDGTTGAASSTTFQAHMTVTLGAPKMGLFLAPGMKSVGEVWVADIGIPAASYEAVPCHAHLLVPDLVSGLLPVRPEHSHKGMLGQVLVLAGSQDYPGAGVLCTYGALRSGAGLVTLAVPSGLDRPAVGPDLLPDATLKRLSSADGGFALSAEDVHRFAGNYRAIVAGSGWGRGPGRRASLENLLAHWAGPLVLDADALNELAEAPQLATSGQDLVLTPHLGEMARLIDRSISDIQKDLPGVAREYAQRHSCTVVLKSATTIVADPRGEVFLCSKPNSGLARGGSGDLLAGLIGGLLATGLPGWHAALTGVFLHAAAGEIARSELGSDAMTISEVAACLPRAFRQIRGEEPPGPAVQQP